MFETKSAIPPSERLGLDDESGPEVSLKKVFVGLGITVLLIAALLIAGPHIDFLNSTWHKVRQGDPIWLLLGVALEMVSFLGYMWVVQSTTLRAGLYLPFAAVARITLAGTAATRVLATAGAGGIAATVFGLRRNGLDARSAASAVAAQVGVIHVVFAALIVVVGIPAYFITGKSASLTLVPAGIAAGLLLLVGAGRPLIAKLADRMSNPDSKIGRFLAAIPATLDDATHSMCQMVKTKDPSILGAVAWQIADAGVLWAALKAFGGDASIVEVLMAYLLGQVANLLPIPGGLGVEAGLIGALVAFGQDPAIALLAATTQRLIAVWLPAVPGAFALASIGVRSPGARLVVPGDTGPVSQN